MPSPRVISIVVVGVVAAFWISFGAARLLRGGADSGSARPRVVEVAHAGIATFGPAAPIPALRSR